MQRRKPGSLKAARHTFWTHVPDWDMWATRPGLYFDAAPWRSRVRFTGGLKQESEVA